MILDSFGNLIYLFFFLILFVSIVDFLHDNNRNFHKKTALVKTSKSSLLPLLASVHILKSCQSVIKNFLFE